MGTTTRAMRELLERKGIKPTGDAKQDMELAKSVMPAPYNKERQHEQSK